MKKILGYIKSWILSLFRVWRREFYLVTRDAGVMLFFVVPPDKTMVAQQKRALRRHRVLRDRTHVATHETVIKSTI